MVDVQTVINIRRPIQDVFAYAIDPDKAPEWYENIKSIEWKTPKPLVVGSRIAFIANFLGRTLQYVYEVIELLPNEKLTMRTADGPFLMETTYLFQGINGSTTKMTLRNRGNPTGFSKLLAPFISMAMLRANRKDLQKIKELLEKN